MPGILLCAMLLGCCMATLMGAAAVTSIDVAHERRTLGTYIDDGAFELRVRQYLRRNEAIRQQTHLNPTGMNGVVRVVKVFEYVQ